MERRVIENVRYVLEEEWMRYAKYGIAAFIVLFGFAWARATVEELRAEVRSPVFDRPQSVVAAQGSEFDFENAVSSLAIESIGVEAPIRFVRSFYPDDYAAPLRQGVAHYPSAVPGEPGTSIILGHSAPLGGFLSNRYEGIFSRLNSLKEGEEIIVFIDGESYAYAVSGKTIVPRSHDIPEEMTDTSGSRLLLITCWPPGVDDQRLIVQADMVQ